MDGKAPEGRLWPPAGWIGDRGQSQMPAGSRHELDDAREGIARVLSQLTWDLERFAAIVALKREMLERRVTRSRARDQDLGQKDLLSLEAAEVAASARQALSYLSWMSEKPGLPAANSPLRDADRREPEERSSS